MTKRALTALILSLSLVLPACITETEPEPWGTRLEGPAPEPDNITTLYPGIYWLFYVSWWCPVMPAELTALPQEQIMDGLLDYAQWKLGDRLDYCEPVIGNCVFHLPSETCENLNTCWQIPGCELL